MKGILSNQRGFTGIETGIVVIVVTLLIGLVVLVKPTTMETANDTRCKNNLKNIYTALNVYQNKYMKYPNAPGDLFLAKLYYTRILVDYDAFICPTDAKIDGAKFDDAVARKIGVISDNWEEGEPDPTEKWNDNTVGPTGISYAARWNVRNPKEHPEKRWYHLNADTREPTPLVCDDCENKKGFTKRLIHGDHLNVLFTGGVIREVKDALVGRKATILEALKN